MTAYQAYQFKAHIIIRAHITCLTGLHIGGSEEFYAVGSVENPIVRDRMSGYPYIPGSSVKGKMRSMVAWMLGKIEPDGSLHGQTCDDPTCAVCRIFGVSVDRGTQERLKLGPTRLCVRDAFPTEHTLKRFLEGGAFIIETKVETSLNRISAEATPHLIERVPRGAQFDLEMLYGIYDMGDGGEIDVANLKQVYTALDLVEASALGGGGSRGAGKIAFEDVRTVVKTTADYQAQASDPAVEFAPIPGRCASDVIARIQKKFALPGAAVSGGQTA